MRNERSVKRVNQAKFSQKFTFPLYDSYCFARIPDTIEHLLTGQSEHPLAVDAVGDRWDQYDMVILFLIDGFGWEFFEKYALTYPFLSRFLQEGVATKITSQFPSTTAAHVTTINTGQEVGQSGVYEWFYYEPLVGQMITPLLYSYAGDHRPNTLEKSGVPPEKLYPTQTLYQKLKAKGVASYVIQQEAIAHSPYSQVMFNGATSLPYFSWKEGLEKLTSLCQKPLSGPTYVYLYFGDIDAMGHRQGVYSSAFADAVDSCWKLVEEHFWKKIQGTDKRIACLVTADHGMVAVDPAKTLYLNQLLPSIASDFEKGIQQKPLVPAGSCRDFFLHIENTRLNSVLQKLRTCLNGIAEVYLTEELTEKGFFGLKKPSGRFLERVGNLVILPYKGESVWWYEKHRFEQHFYGAHGGLTPEEMHSIFLFLSR